MDRIEYAAIALSGDLSVEDMTRLIETDSGISELMYSDALLDVSRLKKIRMSFDSVCRILSSGWKFINYAEESYPAALRNISGPPPVVFYEGNPEYLIEGEFLAIVGSRKADRYGTTAARDFSMTLAQGGLTIVSGLAAGIDSAAHQGALEVKGRTIGVLGTGIDVDYPASNRDLIRRVKENCCVVSEFLPGTRPMKHNFPRRNRIIAGLSRAVFVVQANLRSGSLITARLALENGRDVFALPGDINRENSKGTNWLLKNGGKVITECEDIFEEYPVTLRKTEELLEDSPVLHALEVGPLSFGEMLIATGMSSNELLVELTRLQLSGHIFDDSGVWSRSSLTK